MARKRKHGLGSKGWILSCSRLLPPSRRSCSIRDLPDARPFRRDCLNPDFTWVSEVQDQVGTGGKVSGVGLTDLLGKGDGHRMVRPTKVLSLGGTYF